MNILLLALIGSLAAICVYLMSRTAYRLVLGGNKVLLAMMCFVLGLDFTVWIMDALVVFLEWFNGAGG